MQLSTCPFAGTFAVFFAIFHSYNSESILSILVPFGGYSAILPRDTAKRTLAPMRPEERRSPEVLVQNTP